MSLHWGNNANNEAPSRNRVTLDKRPPRSSKYDDVKSRIDTGSTIQKLKSVTSRQVNKRRDEQFFRIPPKELSDLLSEYESADLEEDIHLNKGFTDYNPRVVVHDSEAQAKIDRPYLILDVRDEQAFRECHIMQARCFPQRLLMQDRSTAELVSFKSAEGKLVVLYDDAQQNRLATAAAQILAARGFDNLYVLAGGISEFALRYSHQIDGHWETTLHPVKGGSKITGDKVNPASGSSSGGSSSSNGSPFKAGPPGGRNEHGGGSITSRSSYNTSHHGRNDIVNGGYGQINNQGYTGYGYGGNNSYHANQNGGGGSSQMNTSRSNYQTPSESGRSSHQSQISAMKSQCQSSSHHSYSSRPSQYRTNGMNSSSMAQYQRNAGGGGHFDENDERASRMSNVSVADSVISRAAQRKMGFNAKRF